MAHHKVIRPIILRGDDAKAAQDALSRSLKDGRAAQMLKEASALPPLVKGVSKK